MITNTVIDLLMVVYLYRKPDLNPVVQAAPALAEQQVIPVPQPLPKDGLISLQATVSAVLAAEDQQSEQPGFEPKKNTNKVTIKASDQTVIASSPVRTPPADIEALIDKYGAEYGVDATKMKVIAACESGYRPEALSSSGLYGGLYQFVDTTWMSNRKAMGLDTNPNLRFNGEEAIKTAAFKMSRDGYGAWPVCGLK
jgi:soluble lytic murein transglycosylase-like protein